MLDTVSVLIALLTRSVKENRKELDEIGATELTDRSAFRARNLFNRNEMLLGIIKARMDSENRSIDGMLRKDDR